MNHILVVDDSSIDRELVRGLLEKRCGFHIEFASNGIEALEHLEAATPLAVVSDLNMPEMDGLALLRQIRRRFPTIPIVLMTAFGSEDIAVEALIEGAADYVPKHRLATELLPAVEEVLSVASGDRPHGEITQFVRYKKLAYEIPSDEKLIAPLADQLQQAAASLGLVEIADRLRFGKCLVEALRNAIQYGGTTSSADAQGRHVLVEVELTPTEAKFVISDQGSGFDPQLVVDPRINPASLNINEGRGLALIQLFMDEVHFNPTGNVISMIKRKKALA